MTKLKTQNVTKFKISKCDKTQKIKCDKTQNVVKLKNSKLDNDQKLEIIQN